MVSAGSSHPFTVPHSRTRLIGREAELAAARAFLLDEAIPLLSLVGPGGVGKTCLALAIADHVAQHFADGVIWCDLAPVRDPRMVTTTLASALRISPNTDQPGIDEIAGYLRHSQVLLLFDNCEHLAGAIAAMISPLLVTCPALQVLATSRSPLHTRGEQILPVSPLALSIRPSIDLGSTCIAPAVELFVQRAHASDPTFSLTASNMAAVSKLCHRLDGLPLAIELAAARIATLPPAAMLELLAQNVTVFAQGPRDAPMRHQTMRDAIAWSYRLLEADDQSFLCAMAVFVGGWTLDAATAVSGRSLTESLQSLDTLVDQSLVVLQPSASSASPRFAILETIREFALAELSQTNDIDAVQRRHARYFRELPVRLDAMMLAYLPNFRPVLDQLVAEYPNIRAALFWYHSMGDASSLLLLSGPLDSFWRVSGLLSDGRRWLEWGLQQHDVSPDAHRMGQLGLAGVLYAQSDAEQALVLCQKVIRSFHEVGDTMGSAFALQLVAHVALVLGDPDLAAASIDDARSQFTSLPSFAGQQGIIDHLEMLRGWAAFLRGELQSAARSMSAMATRQRSEAQIADLPQPHLSWTLLNWGYIMRAQGAFVEALTLYRNALDHGWQFQDLRCCARALAGVAGVFVTHGQWREAARLFGAIEAFCRRNGLDFHAVWALERSFGIPESWWQTDRPLGAEAELVYEVVRERGHDKFPVPQAAIEAWESGWELSFEEAIAIGATTDTVDLLPDNHMLTALPRSPSSYAGIARFTRREKDVLRLLCHRLSDPEIAELLCIGTRTVEFHVANIFSKLGVSNRRDAAAIAARLALT